MDNLSLCLMLFISIVVVLIFLSIDKAIKSKIWNVIILTLMTIFLIIQWIGGFALSIDSKRNAEITKVTGNVESLSDVRMGTRLNIIVDGDFISVLAFGNISMNTLNKDLSLVKISYRDRFYWYKLESEYMEEEKDLIKQVVTLNKIFINKSGN